MLGGVIIVLGGTAIGYVTGGRYVGTDDAYVKAAQLNVTTDVSGMVKTVEVKEGQRVTAGEVLFRIDPEPFQIALDNAKATELQAEMTVTSLRADYRRAQQQVHAQQALVDVAKTTLDSYEPLLKQKSIARTQWDQQQATYLSALATLNSLEQAAVATLARLNGNPDLPVDAFPDVMKARATLAEAQRQLDHTVVRAPFDGIVTAVSSLQPGTLIISAMSAFSTTSAVGLVSDKDVWVEAHMKETDLTRVHSGQAVDVQIDTYPDCSWRGTVEAVAPASGSAFSPLPSENISGNWVKVVQRIPVRIKLGDSACDVRLSTGMSAVVSIDTGYRRWDQFSAR
ncbi:MAG TPA: HlyD family secretion protein [Pseudomonadales bacterium]|nr:HlyD family secretion protein [Pseudomonadales bacterium]